MLSGVSVIIPNWNGAELLETLFVSLRRQDLVEEVIVVDNGSSDNSVEVATAANARVIRLTSNLGFAAAVNQGILSARHDWLLILNNDVELAAGWVQTVWNKAIEYSAWFATGKLMDRRKPENLDGTYDAVCRGGTAWRCGAGRKDGPAWNTEKRIGFAPFTALLASRQLFDRVGLLDESFESYLEDVEFGIRCSKNGLSGVYVPEAIAYHLGSATVGRWHRDTVRRIARNQVLLIARHYPPDWLRRCGWHVFVAQGLWGLIALRHGAFWPWIQGKVEGLRIFRSNRRPGSEVLFSILDRSEKDIRTLQKQTGSDLYWRLYFALT